MPAPLYTPAKLSRDTLLFDLAGAQGDFADAERGAPGVCADTLEEDCALLARIAERTVAFMREQLADMRRLTSGVNGRSNPAIIAECLSDTLATDLTLEAASVMTAELRLALDTAARPTTLAKAA